VRRAGSLSRGVLPSVVFLNCVIVKPQKMRRPRPPRGCQAIGKKKGGGGGWGILASAHNNTTVNGGLLK
jgi:hypothetical protein